MEIATVGGDGYHFVDGGLMLCVMKETGNDLLFLRSDI